MLCEVFRQPIFQMILLSESLLCMSLGTRFVEKLRTWNYDTSKAINVYGYVQVMTIQKFWGNCVVEVQLHCGVNVHLGECEL